MRLPEKKEVAQKRTERQRIEIEEGLKIARKVDSLRNTFAKEEAELNKFRTETVSEVKKEIEALCIDKSVLESEVEILQRKKKEALKPLDDEWNKIKSVKEGLEKTSNDLISLRGSIESKTRELEQIERKLRIEEGLILNAKKEVLENIERTRDALNKADIASKEASTEKQLISAFARDKEKELLSREAGIATRERNNDMRAQSLDKRERELNDRETLINDRYQTLLRDQKRNVKHSP